WLSISTAAPAESQSANVFVTPRPNLSKRKFRLPGSDIARDPPANSGTSWGCELKLAEPTTNPVNRAPPTSGLGSPTVCKSPSRRLISLSPGTGAGCWAVSASAGGWAIGATRGWPACSSRLSRSLRPRISSLSACASASLMPWARATLGESATDRTHARIAVVMTARMPASCSLSTRVRDRCVDLARGGREGRSAGEAGSCLARDQETGTGGARPRDAAGTTVGVEGIDVGGADSLTSQIAMTTASAWSAPVRSALAANGHSSWTCSGSKKWWTRWGACWTTNATNSADSSRLTDRRQRLAPRIVISRYRYPH